MSDQIHSYPFQNSQLPLQERVADLLGRLNSAEKIALLHQYQPAIPRLGIAPFRTGAEALHGVAWLGEATVFPQAIGLGSTWNLALVERVGAATGDEVRGYHYKDRHLHSLNAWAPVVDLLRDPHAGRNEEGYAEDPFLTGAMSVAYAGGMRGHDVHTLKTAPMLKHFLAYNNEIERDSSDSNIDARNLREYYLKAFQPAIIADKAVGVMTSYNLVNGRPATLTPYLSELRSWSDKPLFVVSDAVAPSNIVRSQNYYETAAAALGAALKAGIDSFTDHDDDPTQTIDALNAALAQGVIVQADIDAAVTHLLTMRFRLGEFDADHAYAAITDDIINAPEHHALALEAAREQVVLLKNEDAMLPLAKEKMTRIAVIGERANQVLTDWYSGTLPFVDTPLDALRRHAGEDVVVEFAADNSDGAAVALAESADVVIVMVGNHPTCNAGWAQCDDPSEGKEAVDRQTLELPTEPLIQQVHAANPNTIVVLIASFPYTINWTAKNVPALLWSSHAGQALGQALADVLFGDYAPAGRLTQTWYKSADAVPNILDYDIIKHQRTYLYYPDTPLFPFGHGLTYSDFRYAPLQLSHDALAETETLTVNVSVSNIGTRASDEVMQLYVRARQSRVTQPLKALKGFERIHLEPGETRTLAFTLPAHELAFWDVTREKWVVESGVYDVLVGRSSADIQQSAAITVQGETIPPRDLTRLTRAANFDDYYGAKLVDETKVDGTAVGGKAGEWIVFRSADFSASPTQIALSIANAEPDTQMVALHLDAPDGQRLGRIPLPPTGDIYTYTQVAATIEAASGTRDLYLVFAGSARVSTLQLHTQTGE